jgi:hypothetical protein
MSQAPNPCTDYLTDTEYLEHMIPHHQVAIDMSDLLIPVTENPTMLHLCRDIKRKQSYEIWEMDLILKKRNLALTKDHNGKKDKIQTKLETYNRKNSMANEGGCDPLFFKPDDHMHHMKHMKINDNSYLEHMIPHHQVAIDMSHRLLMHTKNMYLIDFCRKLIIDQQREIYYMNNLLNNTYIHKSDLLLNNKNQNKV